MLHFNRAGSGVRDRFSPSLSAGPHTENRSLGMDVKQIAVLLDGIPFVSSRTAFEVAKDAVEKYIQAYDEEENRREASDDKYNQAILTSKWRDQDRPPPGKKERNGQPLNWAWSERYFFKAD